MFNLLSEISLDLDVTLKWAQIVAYVTVPLTIAYLGYRLNKAVASQNIARDYVNIGLGILKERRTVDNENLHAWALRILQVYSPIPFSSAVKKEIFSNQLSTFVPGIPSQSGQRNDLLITPDGRLVSRSASGKIEIWDLSTGQLVSVLNSQERLDSREP